VLYLMVQIIDAYVSLVMEGVRKEDTKAACCVSSFFYTEMCASGFESLKKWIKVIKLNYKVPFYFLRFASSGRLYLIF